MLIFPHPPQTTIPQSDEYTNKEMKFYVNLTSTNQNKFVKQHIAEDLHFEADDYNGR